MSELSLYNMAPDWRWQRAQLEFDKEQAGDYSFTESQDVLVRSVKRFLVSWHDPDLQGEPLRELMPTMTFLYDLHNEQAPGCTRHAVEAALMAKADAGFMKKNIHPELNEMVIDMYRRIFFEITPERLKSPFWVEKYIFGKACESKGRARTSDLVWKVIGYWGGPERLLKDCIRGHAYNDKDAEWIMRQVVSQNMKETLNFVHSSDKLPKELSMPIHARNLGSWDDRLNRMEQMADQFDTEGIPDGLAVFRQSLKMTTSSESEDSVPAEEELGENIYVYTDEDLLQ